MMLEISEEDSFITLIRAYQNELESPLLLNFETDAFYNTLELLDNQVYFSLL